MSIELTLEKIVKDADKEVFTGPLGLLLSLLEEKKMDVTEIALSQVTEQFLAYLDTLGARKEEELADFLVVATKLLLLKSRALLPQFFPEEEEEAGSLEEQLRLYKRFVEASKKMNALWLDARRTLFREEPPTRPEGFVPPKHVSAEQLRHVFADLLKRLEPPKPLPKTYIDKTVSVREKIDEIRAFLKKKRRLIFSEAIIDKKNKTEIIVGFLALLELVKQQQIGLKQQGTFTDIVIEKI
jgi:segregation and condensation protein A